MEAKERGRKLQIDDFQMMVVLAQESNMRKAAERLFVSFNIEISFISLSTK